MHNGHDRPFFSWIRELSVYKPFQSSTGITEYQEEKQFGIELVLRLLAARKHPYPTGQDVHDYLDEATLALVRDKTLQREAEGRQFRETFDLIGESLGELAFRRWNGSKFIGKFLLSVFEVVAVGVSKNLSKLKKLAPARQKTFITERSKKLWDDPTFEKYSGAGVRGSDRLGNLLPLAAKFLEP